MEELVENYVIYITIIEGRHFDILNMDSVVHISVGKQRKFTTVRKATDAPYFDEYFVFEYNETLSVFLDHHVVLTVIQPRKMWSKRKTLGQFSIDVATIWAAPDHQFYHKWVPIMAALGDKKPGLKGYLKIDVGILTKGKVPRFPVQYDVGSGEDDIEKNLIMPETTSHERTRANYIFSIYNANDIPKIKNKYCKKSLESGSLPSTYVQISFAGTTGKTSIKKNTSNPVWNERIIINEIFPSLSQRIKIELMYTQNQPSAVHYIYLRSICNEGENGYLPTFGPSYIYLYTREISEMTYCGKLLFEMRTEIMTDLMWTVHQIEVFPIRVVPTFNFWRVDDILLFCNIFSVTMIDEKYNSKNVSFELSLGAPEVEGMSENVTQQMKPIPDNIKDYNFLPYNGKVFCISVTTRLENASIRIYNTNMIKKIYMLMRDDLMRVEEIFEHNYKKYKQELQVLFQTIAEKVEQNCRTYLKIVKAYDTPKIELDKKKLEFCIKEMEEIEQSIRKVIYHESKKKIFRKLLSILYKIYTLIDDVQNCWPDVFIWMLYNNKRIGFYRVQVKDIIYSSNAEERGLYCGTLQYIYIKPWEKKKAKSNFGQYSIVLCRLFVQLWVGLQEKSNEGFEKTLQCFKPKSYSKYEIPTILKCENVISVTCVVYVYQGKLEPGADKTGLSDPFLKVCFNEHTLKTKTIPRTISPVWNQTLAFKNIAIYTCMDFLKKNIPHLVIEAYDLDKSSSNCSKAPYEFLGRCDVIPMIFGKDIKPKLQWKKIYDGDRLSGEILMASILTINENYNNDTSYEIVDNIPDFIRPVIKPYRLEVYFWCIHDLKRIWLTKINKPKITIECGGVILESSALNNTKKYLRFPKPHQFIALQLPEHEEFYPPLSIRMYDLRGFGYVYYVGTHMADVKDYLYKPHKASERLEILSDRKANKIISNESSKETNSSEVQEINFNSDLKKNSLEFDVKKFKLANLYLYNKLKDQLKKKKKSTEIKSKNQPKTNDVTSDILDVVDQIDLEGMDWWTKFYMSAEGPETTIDPVKKKLKMKIYPCELENLEEFHHFDDMFHKFKLYRGKRTGDDILDEENIIGTFKAALRIYQWPPSGKPEEYLIESGHQIQEGAFQHYPLNEPLPVVVRVYVIRCINLKPKDVGDGKSDPYIVVRLGENKKETNKNTSVANSVNPTFGRVFELRGTFPNDNHLSVAIWDRDVASSDDLIGETIIDIENRFYTNHRANCGLPTMYIEYGPCMWRDQYKPSHILYELCLKNKLDGPRFSGKSVKVGPRFFYDDTLEGGMTNLNKEKLSLLALNHWKEIPIVGCNLVPEHVETRSLYHYKTPGLEQGKVQLWVDIFPSVTAALPPAVDIKPRAPVPYELRCIIWNTSDVLLEESDFLLYGMQKSDIYVKGWVTKHEEAQTTDVHYNSVTGEGNFNWRFKFLFEYIAAEDKIVYKESSSFFSEETEVKIPCVLNLQVWDNDTISRDDFIGSVQLSLAHLPRGAKAPNLCSLNIIQPGVPAVNLFKTKRHRGWWPLRGKFEGLKGYILTGKVEIEFHLLTQDEARLAPVGIAREDPQGLPPPQRPEFAFNWFMNPMKTLKFLICYRFRAQFFTLLILLFLIVGIYAVPGALVQKLFGL